MSAVEAKKTTRTIPQNDDRRRQLRASRAEKDRAEARVLGDLLNRYVVLSKLAMAAEPTQMLAQVSVAAARRRPPTPPPPQQQLSVQPAPPVAVVEAEPDEPEFGTVDDDDAQPSAPHEETANAAEEEDDQFGVIED
jgi:hypothetical protein